MSPGGIVGGWRGGKQHQTQEHSFDPTRRNPVPPMSNSRTSPAIVEVFVRVVCPSVPAPDRGTTWAPGGTKQRFVTCCMKITRAGTRRSRSTEGTPRQQPGASARPQSGRNGGASSGLTPTGTRRTAERRERERATPQSTEGGQLEQQLGFTQER